MASNPCKFCGDAYQKSKRTILENDLCFANFDGFPVTEGHIKIMTKRHVANFFEITAEEMSAIFDLALQGKKLLDERYHPDGYNVGVNIDSAGGQTIFHVHMHLIPRYKGDVPDPTGGVRTVIPEKGNYLKNINCHE